MRGWDVPRSNTLQVEQLIADLKAIPVEIRKEITPEFKKAAQPVLADARARASWSSRIPGAMSVRGRRSLSKPGASIIVNQARAPHARLYEFGQNGRTFRHPVYGHMDRWVSEDTRPFLIPAVKAGRDQFVAAADRAVQTAARRHGFR